MIISIADPSLGIRQEYAASSVRTVDGQVATGIVVESTLAAITLVDAKNQRITLARDDIDELKPAAQSLMPEKILEPLAEQEVRDLFAYLESGITVQTGARTLVAEFTAGSEDWSVAREGSNLRPEHVLTGGNPDGWLRVRETANSVVVASPRFIGDLTRFEGGMVWFDAKLQSAAGKSPAAFGVLTLSNGTTAIRQTLYHPKTARPAEGWSRFSGRLSPDAFATDEKTFREVLAGVVRMTLSLDVYVDVKDIVGADNFTLQAK
jgi:hypothetical protein